jgi:hypothetical protein
VNREEAIKKSHDVPSGELVKYLLLHVSGDSITSGGQSLLLDVSFLARQNKLAYATYKLIFECMDAGLIPNLEQPVLSQSIEQFKIQTPRLDNAARAFSFMLTPDKYAKYKSGVGGGPYVDCVNNKLHATLLGTSIDLRDSDDGDE